MRILAADIGGTNSRFALFEDHGGGLEKIAETWLSTKRASGFRDLLQGLLEVDFPFGPGETDIAVLAVPGPVKGESFVTMANVAWSIDVADVEDVFGKGRLLLINDFVAQGYACVAEGPAGLDVVKPGQAEDRGTVAVVGAGTGLGHCAVRILGVRGALGAWRVPVPSEAGHAAYPLVEADEADYLRFLHLKTGDPYPYGDMVVSGRGLSLLHEFLTGESLPPPEVAARIAPDSPTTAYFAKLYGRACRNYALTVVATGGLYIAGGVAAKNPMLVTHPTFAQEFVRAMHYQDMLAAMPVWLSRKEDRGLWGAAWYGHDALLSR